MKNLIYSPLICLPHIVIFALVFMCCVTTSAQWSNDPTVNNAICVYTGSQSNPKTVSDGDGGAIITWEDTRSGSYDIYAQKISSGGVVQWNPSTGVVISATADNQANPTIVSDGAGGAIIAWQDLRSGNYDVYAQKIGPFGNVLWQSDGVLICNAVLNQIKPTIVTDDSGGAIITWEDFRSGSGNYDVYSQRINSDGVVKWTSNGETICNTTNNSMLPTIVSVSDGLEEQLLHGQI